MGVIDRARKALGIGSDPTVTPAIEVDSVEANALAAAPRYFGGPGVLTNLLSGLNTTEDKTWWDVWYQRRPLTDDQRRALGLDPLVRRILSLPGDDALREGYTVKLEGLPEDVDGEALSRKIADYADRRGVTLDAKLRDASTRSRQYGAAIVVLGIDDGRAPNQPVDINAIKRIWWAAVIDWRDFDYGKVIGPRGGTEDWTALTDADKSRFDAGADRFGSVLTYRIRDINGALSDGIRWGDGFSHGPAEQIITTAIDYEVHADRVLYLPYDEALPLVDQLQDALAAYFRGMSGISRAIDRASLLIWKLKNHVAQSWSENHGIGERRVRSAMKSWSALSAMVLDKDDEDLSMSGSGSTSGLADAINPIMLWICAATGIPATRLFGMSPGGFGKGDAEREQWHDQIRALQSIKFAPLIRKFARYACAAQDGGIGLVLDEGRFTVEFDDLDSPTDSERAETLAKTADAVAKLVRENILLPDEAARMLPDIELDTEERERRKARGQSLAPMTVGVFDGLIKLLAEAPGVTPAQKRAILSAAEPERFTPEVAAAIFPDAPAQTSAPADPGTPPPSGATPPAGESERSSEPPPPPAPTDTVDGSTLARELGIPAVRLTLAAKRGDLRNYDLLGGRPRYSRAEVMELIRKRNLSPDEAAEELAAEAEALAEQDAADFLADTDDKNEERIAEAFKRYHETVNMGAAELRAWAKSPWSKKASLSDGPIDRNLTLLTTPRKDWTAKHAASAMRTVSFVSRMRGAEQGKPVKIDGREGPSKRDISLKNWAFDPGKSSDD